MQPQKLMSILRGPVGSGMPLQQMMALVQSAPRNFRRVENLDGDIMLTTRGERKQINRARARMAIEAQRADQSLIPLKYLHRGARLRRLAAEEAVRLAAAEQPKPKRSHKKKVAVVDDSPAPVAVASKRVRTKKVA